jgi:hypothetical protein
VTPRLSLTKTHRPSGDVITPNGAAGTWVITGRTPARVRTGATATLHPGAFSERAGTLEGNGAVVADGGNGGDGGLGGLAGAGAGPQEASNATAPDAAVTARARRALPVFIPSA